MIEVATIVSQSGYVKLRDAFQIVSPCVSYTAERARRKLLQMPLASVTVGKPSDGNSYAILTECFKDERVGVLVNAMIQAQYQQVPKKLDKGCVRMLLNLAQNDRERECLKYTVIKASGISASEARRRYGFENMTTRLPRVEKAIAEVQEIREAFESLARIQDKAVLATFGMVDSGSSDDSDFETVQDELHSQEVQESDQQLYSQHTHLLEDQRRELAVVAPSVGPGEPSGVLPPIVTCRLSEGPKLSEVDQQQTHILEDQENHHEQRATQIGSMSEDPWETKLGSEVLKSTLEHSCFNWFEFWAQIEQLLESDPSTVDLPLMKKVFDTISELGLSDEEVNLTNQSYYAFLAAESDQAEDRQRARALNGEVVSECESDDPEAYLSTTNPLSIASRRLVAKKRTAVKRRATRLKAKAIASANLLSKQVSKRCSTILRDCPDIGKTIESFVENGNVGADHWRRTGVLTFDGNARLEHKVTYGKIKSHLEKVYNRHISYGTVVQLCVPRNQRRRSAKRYRGVAHVTTRRARKGFNLRYNPDSHWSAALYKGLNDMQFKDGRNMMVLNRDDAAGFRLDTLVTSKQYGTPALQGHDVLTTRTDYVNKYPSTLQTTCYNFPSTGTTVELCAGIVKAPGLFQKNPAQHASDMEMLKKKQEFLPACETPDGRPKLLDCIRVDGASDEGPGHEEVQYWWTRRHLLECKVVTLLTTRSSGSSYLNRVELQNGCLSRAHSNTFIPSTLAGSNLDRSGSINREKLHENLQLAINAYISRCDGCPCGRTTIHLFKGNESPDFHEIREDLLVFLKGSKKNKEALKQRSPNLYTEFQKVWYVRTRHMVKGLPSQYIFMLICCFEPTCPHPMCQAGRPEVPYTWYPGGPLVTHLPLPVPDPERPWGLALCQSCKGFCSGHYKAPTYVNVTDQEEMMSVAQPPSSVLKQLVSTDMSDAVLKSAAERVLLSPEETQIWIDHLKTVTENHRRGAEKAAATRRAKKAAKALTSTMEQ